MPRNEKLGDFGRFNKKNNKNVELLIKNRIKNVAET